MKTLGFVLAVLLVFFSGCEPGPRVDFDPRVLDSVPVVPVKTGESWVNGLLLPNGDMLTCSHAIPRHTESGKGELAGWPVRFWVVASGDQLETVWNYPQDMKQQPVPSTDWAYLRFDPPLRPKFVFDQEFSTPISYQPPVLGETLFAVGYVFADGDYRRQWTPGIVVEPPESRLDALSEPVYWLRGLPVTGHESLPEAPETLEVALPASGSFGVFRRGLSGSPVIRRRTDGKLEACGIYIAGGRRLSKGEKRVVRDAREEYGLVIPIPRLEELVCFQVEHESATDSVGAAVHAPLTPPPPPHSPSTTRSPSSAPPRTAP